MGVHDVRLTGGEPLVRRDFPQLAAMLAASTASRTSRSRRTATCSSATPRRSCDAGVNRFNVSIDSLQRDRFFEMTRRDALPQVLRGLEALARSREAHPIKINAVAIRDFTEEEALAVRGVRARAPLRGALHRVHAARRRPRLDARQVLTGDEIRAAIDARPPARARAARAARDRARLPLRRRARQDRLHQPGQRAVLRRLQPHPPHRRRPPAHLPLLAERDRPARPLRAGASDDELERIIRDAVWRKELKHRVNEPGFVQPERTMSAIGG